MTDTSQTEEAIDSEEAGEASLLSRIPRLGLLSWSFVGFVVASIIVLFAFSAVSEITLPMLFAESSL